MNFLLTRWNVSGGKGWHLLSNYEPRSVSSLKLIYLNYSQSNLLSEFCPRKERLAIVDVAVKLILRARYQFTSWCRWGLRKPWHLRFWEFRQEVQTSSQRLPLNHLRWQNREPEIDEGREQSAYLALHNVLLGPAFPVHLIQACLKYLFPRHIHPDFPLVFPQGKHFWLKLLIC